MRLSEKSGTGFVWHYSAENSDAVTDTDENYIDDDGSFLGSWVIKECRVTLIKGVENTFRFKCYRKFEPEYVDREHIITISNTKYGSSIAARGFLVIIHVFYLFVLYNNSIKTMEHKNDSRKHSKKSKSNS